MEMVLERPADLSRNQAKPKEAIIDMESIRSAAAQVGGRIVAFTDKLAAEIGAEIAKKYSLSQSSQPNVAQTAAILPSFKALDHLVGATEKDPNG